MELWSSAFERAQPQLSSYVRRNVRLSGVRLFFFCRIGIGDREPTSILEKTMTFDYFGLNSREKV